MYAPLKIKESKKNKKKIKKHSNENEITVISQLSNIQITNEETSGAKNDGDTILLELAQDNQQDILNEHNNEKEKKILSASNSLFEIQGQSSKSDDLQKENENIPEVLNYSVISENKEPDEEKKECFLDEVIKEHVLDKGNIDKKCNVSLGLSSTKELKNDTSNGDYCNLVTKVKAYAEEISEPSAPIEKQNDAIVNFVKKSTIGNNLSCAEKELNICNYKFSFVLQDLLPPFSDEKLSKFYYNPELKESIDLENAFILQELHSESKKDHILYKLLVEYMQAKNRCRVSEVKINDLNKKLNTCISSLWTVWNDIEITEKEKCADGNLVSFVEKYAQAQFNTDIFKESSSVFSQIKNELYKVFVSDLFNYSIIRLKIENFLQSLLTSCPEFTNIEADSYVKLSPFSLDSHFQQCLLDLKVSISILFMFQRKQTLEVDSTFLEETRNWLSDLVAVFLRVGTWKDHIFLLHHIIRCPGGIGEWAVQFVQFPLPNDCIDPFKNPELNHMMTVMSILLSPVEQRENFIKKWESELTNDCNPWTVIDSDGEVEDDEQQSCPLKENDLVSLLNQIPFSHLFKTLLKCDSKEIGSNYVTSEYIFKLFSFFTDFVKILLSGLKLYSTQRYRQFTKRLGRLIYHVVQYATDALITLKSQKFIESEMTRIQVEYDNFFLRCTKFIYSAKKHGTWQFLAMIPYDMASSNAILKLFGILQLNENENESILKVDFSTFVENFLLLPEEEQFYLLTTFANMALARNIFEIQFIKNVMLQLLFIGFLNPSTRDHCYKNVRTLLCSICSSYSFLMSEILYIQNNTFVCDPANDQKRCLDLWAKLPVEIWQPMPGDLEILSNWLLEPFDCVRNELGRLIIQSLNFDMKQGNLFIPAKHHHEIALMILRANAKLVLGNEAGVIKNVSNLVLYQTPDQSINEWTWNVLLKLRLHLLDKSDAEMCKCFCNIPDSLKNVPDVESNIELHHLVLKKHPAACYIALMTTTMGHSVPIICEKGFELIEILFNLGKYEPGLACLEFMTLLFLECSDSLYKCEKFISLLCRLIAADNSYVQFAKNLISYNFPGPVLKCVENMMQHQLNRWKGLNFSNYSLLELWFLSLTKLPLWTQEPGVLYLIDRLLQNSFFDSVSTKKVTAILKDLLEAQSSPSETKSLVSLVGWINSKYNPPSLLLKGYNGEVPWFSYLLIHMEYEEHEKNNSIWPELIKELYSCGDKKINVDNSLKKVCNFLRLPVRSSSVLAIYKWCYQILETDISHPLVPLIYQRFFSLYFYRVPGLTDQGSISYKFFDGVVNQGLFKRLKSKLQETCDHFKTLSENTEETDSHEHYLKTYNLFQTFSIWIHDPNLHKPCLNFLMLPTQYNPELLGLLISKDETPWIEYLEHRDIESNFKNLSTAWLKLKNRIKNRNRNKTLNYRKEKSLKEKLLERLNSYEAPLPPPVIDSKKYSFPRVNFNLLINADKMILFIKPFLRVLLEYMKHYNSKVSNYVSLICDMEELLPRLYFTVESQKVLRVHCSGVQKTVNGKSVAYSCSGPAVVKLNYQESKINDQVKQQVAQCEKAFQKNLEETMVYMPSELTSAAVLIDIAIEKLIQEHNTLSKRKDEDKILSDLKNTGVHLFYELIRFWSEQIFDLPALESGFDKYVDTLGNVFIVNNAMENERILHLMLSEEKLTGKICRYFTPNASSTNDFIANYSKALDFVSEQRFTILSKFNMCQWLSEKNPKLSERSCMIETVGRGLKSLAESNEDQQILNLLNQHLENLFMYDFPEHYGEILNFLLEASQSHSINISTWFTFLNALTSGHFEFNGGLTDKKVFEPGQSVKKLKLNFTKFAASQSSLSYEIIKGTIALLGSTFKAERLKSGTQGLFKKYRFYIEPLFIFLGMLSYSFITKAVEIDTGSLSDKLAQQIWPLLCELYSPWLVPYWVEKPKDQTIHEHNPDHNVLLPWAVNDSCHALLGSSVFVESIRFLIDALPGLNHVHSYSWYFYVTNFAHIYVKDHVLNVIHDSLLSIPWENFFPCLQDLELMLKVVDQFLPLSHSFLGSIFVNIKWTELVYYYLSVYDVETATKLHVCLLNLLVKLPLEPSLKQNEKVLALLTEANGYAWHLVDSTSYEAVLNWFIMSCDPRIILMDERLDYYKLDSAILKLFQVCAGYVPFIKSFHPTTSLKRMMFIRTCIKWLITSNRRFKTKNSPLFKTALTTLWNDLETVVYETVPPNQRNEEAGNLLSEFLVIFSEQELRSIVETSLSNWLSTHKSQIIVFGLFRAAGKIIEDFRTFGSVIECCLETYFNNIENCDWEEVTQVFELSSKSKSEDRLEKVLIDNNYFLTLYAVLIKKYSNRENDLSSKVILTDLLQLLCDVKPNEYLESKLILFICFGLNLATNEIKLNVKEGVSYLAKFYYALYSLTSDKGNGFLSAIGLKKSGFSSRFKLMCLIACSGIVMFMKNNYPEYQELDNEKILQALETAETNKLYQNIQEYVSYAKITVKEFSSMEMEQIIYFLKHIGFKLFNKLYLK